MNVSAWSELGRSSPAHAGQWRHCLAMPRTSPRETFSVDVSSETPMCVRAWSLPGTWIALKATQAVMSALIGQLSPAAPGVSTRWTPLGPFALRGPGRVCGSRRDSQTGPSRAWAGRPRFATPPNGVAAPLARGEGVPSACRMEPSRCAHCVLAPTGVCTVVVSASWTWRARGCPTRRSPADRPDGGGRPPAIVSANRSRAVATTSASSGSAVSTVSGPGRDRVPLGVVPGGPARRHLRPGLCDRLGQPCASRVVPVRARLRGRIRADCRGRA